MESEAIQPHNENPAPTPAAEKAPSPLAEKMGEKLRASVRERRPRRWTAWLLALLIAVAPLALLGWWFWPRGEPSELAVVAFDQVLVGGEGLTARAALEPVSAKVKPSAARRDLTFEEQAPGRKGERGVMQTDEAGAAALNWPAPKEGRGAYIVRYVDAEKRAESASTGRVFVLPENADVLLVEVASLTEAGEKLGADGGPTDSPLLPGAAEALREAAKRKFVVMYLAVRAERAVEYGRQRDWVERQAGRIPDGPVLGRGSFDGKETDYYKAAASLLDWFDGVKVAVALDDGTISRFNWNGFKRHIISPKEGSWKAVPPTLQR